MEAANDFTQIVTPAGYWFPATYTLKNPYFKSSHLLADTDRSKTWLKILTYESNSWRFDAFIHVAFHGHVLHVSNVYHTLGHRHAIRIPRSVKCPESYMTACRYMMDVLEKTFLYGIERKIFKGVLCDGPRAKGDLWYIMRMICDDKSSGGKKFAQRFMNRYARCVLELEHTAYAKGNP